MRIEQQIKRFTKGQAITNIILTKKKKSNEIKTTKIH